MVNSTVLVDDGNLCGESPIGGVFGGSLYHLNLGIAGRPEYRASIRSREVA
jgi:hypothetical protein